MSVTREVRELIEIKNNQNNLSKNIGYIDENTTRVVVGNQLLDSFGRIKISNPVTVFDSKQIYDNQPLYWDELLVSGAGITSSHSTNTASSTMTSTLNTAGRFVRQTYRSFIYQPGKSSLILMTGILVPDEELTSNAQRRIGYYNDNNGFFFEHDGTNLKIVRRSFVTGVAVDSSVIQSSWNIDTLDGTGISGITLDITKTHIFVITFQWLGVGSITWGFEIDGKMIPVHRFDNANINTTVTTSTPNLPLRYEMITTGSSPSITLNSICSAVILEGGQNNLSLVRSLSNSSIITGLTVGSTYALIGIRLTTSGIGTTINILQYQGALFTTLEDAVMQLIFNPTITGVPVWQSLSNSSIEYFEGGSTITVTGGTVISEKFLFSSNNNNGVFTDFSDILLNNLTLGESINGTRDTFILAIRPITTLDCGAILQWSEFF